jgi:2,4-dienoyl-CoA reductase-like NADH-dependent reductase (Old Yellow Enzyme family)
LLKAGGKVDLIDCSSGGSIRAKKSSFIQVTRCRSPRQSQPRCDLRRARSALINSPELAEQIVASGQADVVVNGACIPQRPALADARGKSIESQISVAGAIRARRYF